MPCRFESCIPDLTAPSYGYLADLNKTTLIGRVGNDATAKEINGKTVHNFSVAVSKKVNGNEQTTWFDCAIWEKPNVATYIKKGTHIYLEGEVKADAYLKDGEAKSVLRLTVFQIQLLGGGNKDTATEQPTQPNIPASASEAFDLPF